MRYKIIYKPFPEPLRGIVRALTSLQGNLYTILIDALLDDSERKEAIKHELSHIVLGHFLDDQRSVEELEAEADAHAAVMTDDELIRLMGRMVI